MRGLLVIGLLAGCYRPKVHPGAPCDSDGACPDGLVCAAATQTCEETDSPPPIDATPPDACVPAMEICGNGIDEDCDGSDLACATNDKPDAPIDVTAGGTFMIDTTIANDDLEQHGCGGAGGRDLFYAVTLAAPQVYYFDTFGSGITTTLRIFPGKACDALGTGFGGPCNRGACGGSHSQMAHSLPAGTSCIVFDQDSGEDPGTAKLKVTPGGRDGDLLGDGMQSNTGNTCNGADDAQPGCANDNNAKDLGYFMTACPGQTRTLSASTCVDVTVTNFDTVVYVRTAGGTELDCNDDTATCAARPDRPDKPDGSVLTGVSLKGPGLFWVVVDGYNGVCGNYQLDTDLE